MYRQLQETKNKLSRVAQETRSHGPQTITLRGKEAAALIPAEDYRRLTDPKGALVGFLRSSPWAEADLDLERSKDIGRDRCGLLHG